MCPNNSRPRISHRDSEGAAAYRIAIAAARTPTHPFLSIFSLAISKSFRYDARWALASGGRHGKEQHEQGKENNGGCDLNATVHVLHFNEGKTDIINQYIMFCRVFNDQLKKYGYSPKTIQETLRICKDKGILAEYIKKMEGEIMDIMAYMFDEENNKRLFGLEQQKIGEIKEKRKTAINLLNMNMDISIIEKATGLSEKEILKLKDKK